VIRGRTRCKNKFPMQYSKSNCRWEFFILSLFCTVIKGLLSMNRSTHCIATIVSLLVTIVSASQLYGQKLMSSPTLTASTYPRWEVQNSGVNVTLWDIFFIDNLNGWACGDSASVLATSDGGKTWLPIFEFTDSVRFDNVQFINKRVGFVGGNRLERLPTHAIYHPWLFRTTNGGQSWERCDSTFGSGFILNRLQFVNADTGWVALNNPGFSSFNDREGMLLKTTDSGKSWFALIEKKPELIGSFSFLTPEFGYSFWGSFTDNFDDTDVYVSSDGGVAWAATGRIKVDQVTKSSVLSEKELWAVGYGISHSQDGGRNWSGLNWFNPVQVGQKRIRLFDIGVAAPDRVWLGGIALGDAGEREGVILTSTDSGETWQYNFLVPYGYILALYVLSERSVWAVGSQGLIIRSVDAITIALPENEAASSTFRLEQNYPNPFNSRTRISFTLPEVSFVSLTIVDALGRNVAVLINDHKPAGVYYASFDFSSFSSGAYFFILHALGKTETKSAFLIR